MAMKRPRFKSGSRECIGTKQRGCVHKQELQVMIHPIDYRTGISKQVTDKNVLVITTMVSVAGDSAGRIV